MSAGQIAAYVATGESMDKAGAYGIQGMASRYVSRVEGCYPNVMGLPVSLVCDYLSRLRLLD
jgi:septum formation protein